MSKPIITENLFKEVFDSLPDGIVVLDTSFSTLSINDAAENLFKISRRKAFGKPSSTFLPEEIEETARKVAREERTVFGDGINAVLRGGEKVSIQAIASPIFSSETGVLSGIIVQIKDLTGTKFLSEKNIQQASALTLEGLVLGLAHELKNPLSGIRGAAQILLEEKTNRDTVKCGEIIIKEVDRLLSLLQMLKGLEPFAKEVFEPVDVHEILTEIIFLESKSNQKIEFIQSFDVTLPPILGDTNSLKQVFLNLINNAVQAISDKGTIEISTRWITEYKLKDENAISVEIRDSGTGIEKGILEKIFTPFYTTKKEGAGLGLFLAYQIVAKHGGAIFVDSEPGKGSVFNVYLPIYK
ncbi:MAG TPA: ATP-binding protein [Thermodesulfobacteriota bacterium]|nr:ATP-binding protein [Thermodesulfobacteriota bacterium]